MPYLHCFPSIAFLLSFVKGFAENFSVFCVNFGRILTEYTIVGNIFVLIFYGLKDSVIPTKGALVMIGTVISGSIFL